MYTQTSGRVETSSRAESSWVELGSVVWRGSAYTDYWVFLVFRRTSHISWVDRLVPTPKYSSSSRGLDSSVVSAGLTTDVLGSPLVCQSTSAASLFRLLESQSTGHDRHRAGINNIQWLVGVHIGYEVSHVFELTSNASGIRWRWNLQQFQFIIQGRNS